MLLKHLVQGSGVLEEVGVVEAAVVAFGSLETSEWMDDSVETTC